MTPNKPLVSIIIPTKNVASHIEPCLQSIKIQKGNFEIETLVIDNFSNDLTKKICKKYPITYLEKGPERHSQRRYGVEKSKGDFLFFLDSDMELDPGLIQACLSRIEKTKAKALIIPEKPVGAPNFWTQCKVLERSLYDGDDQTEAARFFIRKTYESVGGFDTKMIALEDWDLTQKVRSKGVKIERISSHIIHQEGYVTLKNLWQKKAYYGGESTQFIKKNGWKSVISKIYFFRPVFYKNFKKIFARPHIGLGMIFLLCWELLAGAYGLIRRMLGKTPQKTPLYTSSQSSS